MAGDCLKVTCTTQQPHEHGHSCDGNCEACNGRIVVLKDLPSTKEESEH